MIVFPNCKINLGLQVLRKRADGYHDISTIFYPIPLTDSLELVTDITLKDPILFTSSGIEVGTSLEENLCVRAFRLLKSRYPELPSVRMHLHKVIPMGAGLGGGSSDAAFTLKLINQKYQLGISTGQLQDFALELGSDCPFFIENKPCFATGRGEEMQPASIDLSRYKLVLVYPGIHISTSWAFGAIDPGISHIAMDPVLSEPVNNWKNFLV
ncbi:MAG TPA: 4-(cytidine 5'-diphospho)-2-C-methyl-D-erythritol kinase, partial [Flavitalea sp.]|nr:4-(cytidine 5'-diphospho)-2-C-methyl-D-erythritol kinase [Flavitalea sp.]